MDEPWLSFLILSEPLCSCSSRTRSSLCCQRRRPFICWASSSCSCSFCSATEPSSDGRRGHARPGGGGGSQRSYLYVELGPPQQVERGVPHRVRGQRNLLLQLLQALPQLGSPVTQQTIRVSFTARTSVLIIPFQHQKTPRINGAKGAGTCSSPARCGPPCRQEQRRGVHQSWQPPPAASQ